jgi:CRP-like cAMP-binding protein
MADPTIAAFARVPLFSGLATQDLATLAAASAERHVERGTLLTRQGEPGDEFFVVADGEVRIDVGGQEVRRLGPGDFLGEIALVYGGLRTATATVERAAALYVLDRPAFESMLRRHPRIEDRLLTSVTERMRFR